jgi:hypothetical protein
VGHVGSDGALYSSNPDGNQIGSPLGHDFYTNNSTREYEAKSLICRLGAEAQCLSISGIRGPTRIRS